jgi:urea carboxylase
MATVRDDAPWCPWNIEFIRRVNGLVGVEDVRRIVFEASYLVLGLGDVYLGAPVATPLDPRHRLVTTKYNPARTWTPENAVGIGGAYLCVYGMEGPGGYQLFGRTVPVWNTWERWADDASDTPWLLRFFDQIRFHPVSAEELVELRRDLRAGRWAPHIEEDTFRIADHRRAMREIAPEIEGFRRGQQAAFRAERERWVASGEFDSAARAERSLIAVAPELDPTELFEDAVVVRAPLGAQVLHVAAVEGAGIAAGADLVVLTAMKMETTLTAPVSGRVVRVLCKPGQVVSPSSPLVVLQPDA